MAKKAEAITEKQSVFDGTAKVKHTVNDSVFKDLFSDLENVRSMYVALHPEDADITTADISDCTHKSIFVETILNDLSFMVRDRLMIMVEAQSKWSLNVVFRLMSYAVQALNDYVKKNNMDKYGSALLKLPKVELYVLYTGKITKRYEELSLADLYYDGDNRFLDAKAKVLYGDDGNDIVCQYAKFIRVLDSCCDELGSTREAVLKAIDICKNKDILREYLSKREVDVVDIMTALFDQDYVLGVHIDNKIKKAVEKEKLRADRAEERAVEAERKQEESVKEMLRDNVPIEIIMRYTQLCAEQIKEIAIKEGISL